MEGGKEEKTLIIFKPDAVRRKMVHTLLAAWEMKGFVIELVCGRVPKKEEMELHYAEHKGKGFYEALVKRMSTGYCVFVVFSGTNVVCWSREKIMQIRRDYATSMQENLVHGSDSIEAAIREIEIWFPTKKV